MIKAHGMKLLCEYFIRYDNPEYVMDCLEFSNLSEECHGRLRNYQPSTLPTEECPLLEIRKLRELV